MSRRFNRNQSCTRTPRKSPRSLTVPDGVQVVTLYSDYGPFTKGTRLLFGLETTPKHGDKVLVETVAAYAIQDWAPDTEHVVAVVLQAIAPVAPMKGGA
jgi:hypothetical protein